MKKEKEAGIGPSFKKSVHYLNYKSGYRISGTIKLKETKPSLFPRLKPFRHKTLCCYLLHSNKTASFFVSDVQINPGENFSGGFKTEIFRPIHLEDKLEAGALMDQPVNPINWKEGEEEVAKMLIWRKTKERPEKSSNSLKTKMPSSTLELVKTSGKNEHINQVSWPPSAADVATGPRC